MKTIINWRVFLILWIAAILSTIALLPYVLELESSALMSLDLPISLPALITLQIVQSAILVAIIIFAGMFFASRIGLGIPILDSVTRNETASGKARAMLPLSLGLGVIAEEILLRLFFMSLFAWLGRFVSKTQEGKPTRTVLCSGSQTSSRQYYLGWDICPQLK